MADDTTTNTLTLAFRNPPASPTPKITDHLAPKIREICFEPRGFIALCRNVNFPEWNERLCKFVGVPLDRETTVRLWSYVVLWYFSYWSPVNPRDKNQRILDTALKQPEKYKKLMENTWEIRAKLADYSMEKIEEHWKDVDFSAVTEYLDEQALKYPETFKKDSLPMYVKPRKVNKAELEFTGPLRQDFQRLTINRGEKFKKKRLRPSAMKKIAAAAAAAAAEAAAAAQEGDEDAEMGGFDVAGRESKKRGRDKEDEEANERENKIKKLREELYSDFDSDSDLDSDSDSD